MKNDVDTTINERYPMSARKRNTLECFHERQKRAATIAEQQARLDAIAYWLECVELNAETCGYYEIGKADVRVVKVLARGTPRRECAALVKRYGKEKKRGKE